MASTRNLHPFRRNGEDIHRAVIFDVNFATGFLDELLDVLAAGADERADLLRIDLHDLDARGVLAEFLARFGESLRHFGEDVQAGDAGFLNRLGHKRVRDALELEVELEAGDAFVRAGNFAIHVAEVVFRAEDVGEEFVTGNVFVGRRIRCKYRR